MIHTHKEFDYGKSRARAKAGRPAAFDPLKIYEFRSASYFDTLYINSTKNTPFFLFDLGSRKVRTSSDYG